MDLKLFIATYDYPESTLLFGGKRDVKHNEDKAIQSLGRLLASQTKHILFRSGNARGADEQFSLGIIEHAPQRLQVITPYTAHRKNKNVAYDTISIDTINLASEPEVVYNALAREQNKFIVNEYLQGKKNKSAAKGSYLVRDTVMVLGAQGIQPANCALFYDDLENPRTGGTGYTMNICQMNHIPFLDQCIWLNWLNEAHM